MIFDWDLWPIYLDRHWVDAEAMKRLAEMARRMAAAMATFTMSMVTAGVAVARLGAVIAAAQERQDPV